MGHQGFLTPERGHWRFRPTRKQLRSLLDYLFSSGWARPESKCREDSLVYLHPSNIEATIRATREDECLTVYLEGGPGDGPYPDVWPEDQLEFTANLCDDVYMIDSPEPLILPVGVMELTLPCPACAQDILEQLPRWDQNLPLEEDFEWPPYTSLAANGYHRVPQRCPGCSQELNPPEMALCSGSERIDEVPFFHFCIAILAARSPNSPLTSVDPDLLGALERICGVRFRTTWREV